MKIAGIFFKSTFVIVEKDFESNYNLRIVLNQALHYCYSATLHSLSLSLFLKFYCI